MQVVPDKGASRIRVDITRLLHPHAHMNEGVYAFPTTQWTSVVKAARSGNTQHRHEAMTALSRDYWMPLYAFSRRLGNDRHDAEDLTQGFFAYLLQHTVLDSANRELGTLRTFLLKVFQRYIGDVRERETAQKRGAGMHVFSLDIEEGEHLALEEVAGKETPEMLYDRDWARSVLRTSLKHLEAMEQEAGRERQFEVLEPHLNPDAESDASYEHAIVALGMNAESVRQAVSRLRKRFRTCLREQIAATLQEPDDARIDEELHALKAALRH